MTGAITWEQVAGLISIIGAVAGVWWFLQRQITDGARALDGYKLHVAETYTTKSGMKEIKEEILGAVGGIRDDVRHLATRIDTMHEAKRPTRRSAE